jgi:hypothetical protein
VVLFSMLPLLRFPIQNVVTVRRFSQRQLWLNPFFPALRCGNRLFGEAVLIRSTRGLVRAIVITPSDPTKFIEQYDQLKSSARNMT